MIVALGNHPDMKTELDALQAAYEQHGIEVKRMNTGPDPDAVFVRDCYGWTPFGMIRPQLMGKESRRSEPLKFFQWRANGSDLPQHAFWLREGLFEGADLLWTTRRHCIIGIGSRTNEVAARQIEHWLYSRDPVMTVTITGFPPWHEQHLLGLLNVVQGWQLFCDEKVLDACGPRESWPTWLWPTTIALPHDEYATKHSNWVQHLDKIFIGDRNVQTIKILEEQCEVIPVKIDSLLAHGGGVACATGIIVE